MTGSPPPGAGPVDRVSTSDLRVFAHVLTFGAPDELERCVAAITAQRRPPDQVIVIDNAGDPPARVDVTGDSPIDVRVHREAENYGPAGGHAAGLRRFLDSGADYAWVMDDDFEPEPGALEALLDRAEGCDRPALVWPTQLGIDGSVDNYPGWCAFLVHRDVVRDAGLPRRDLVWWIEDTEYLQWRLPRTSAAVVREPSAIVRHLGGRKVPQKPPWKLYYETRNAIWYRTRVQRLTHPVKLLRTLAVCLKRAVVPGPERSARVRCLLKGIVDGSTGRLGKRVPLPTD